MNLLGRFRVFVTLLAAAVMGCASAQVSAGALPRGADSNNVVMSSDTGPVALHLAAGDRLIACQYAARKSPDALHPMSESIVVFDLKSGRELHRMDYRTERPNWSACTPDGRYLVIVGKKLVHHLDLEQGKVVRTWPIDFEWAIPVISPDGSTLALSLDRVISLWDLETGRCKQRLESHPTRLRTFAFDDSGKTLISSCGEVTRIWDLASGKGTNLQVHNQFASLAMDRDRTRLFVTQSGQNGDWGAACYDLRSGRRLTFLDRHNVMAIDFATDRWYTVKDSGEALIEGIQVRKLSNPAAAKYLAFDDHLKRLTRSKGGFGGIKLSLSPDKRYLLGKFGFGCHCQVWSLERVDEQDLLSSATTLKRPPQSEWSPARKNLSKEELFLDRIYGICPKVQKLKDEGKEDLAAKEIEALVAAGRKRLQRAPRRHQTLLFQCGQAYKDYLQDQEKGMKLIREALKLAETGKRFDSSWRSLIGEVANDYAQKGNRRAAADAYRRIINQYESSGTFVSGSDLRRLAQHERAAGNQQEAMKLFYRSWHQAKAQYGTLHESTRIAYDALVAETRMFGGWKSLEPILVLQLDDYERYKGPDHPETGEAALQLAELYERLGKPELALATMDRSQRIFRDHVARQLPSLSETEQKSFLASRFHPSLDAALQMAVRLERQPNAAELSASWILNGKGASTRALAERARIAASTDDPEVQAIAAELAETRAKLSSLSLAAMSSETTIDAEAGDSPNEMLSELKRLREKESELSWKLGMAGWTELRRDPWAEISAIRDKIPSDSVLLELTIAGLSASQEKEAGREASVGPQRETPKVVMWIVPPSGQGKVRMAVLCDDLMNLARPLAGFYACVEGRLSGNQVAAASRQCLAAIAAQLVRPLPSDVKRAKKWLVSPDHLLWLIPWAALPESGDRLVVHGHQVQYLLSGRDLLTLPSNEAKTAPMIVANPLYTLGENHASRESAFSPLPGTAREAESVLPYLRNFAATEPELYVGADASESVVKNAQRPKVALLSTHGFATVIDDEHPMATCGLAFAGANSAIKGDGDGVLTGLEILAADYRGTELVVLSACQTASGSISSGEGVASLRYAFQLAGARNVAATLWSIPDAVTADLINDFFKLYTAGKSPAAALRFAQLATIKRLERNGNVADPSQWAAFTIAGPPMPDAYSSPDVTTGSPLAGPTREWRSANGEFSVIAQLVSVTEQQVVLRKQGGSEIEVPLSQIHPQDREFASRSHEGAKLQN